jgi:16S rRNA (cytosine967-C5)-methyltransferase
VTPSARLAAAIELISAIDSAPQRPADAVANDYFRERRFIGSGDRRGVSERVWNVLRSRRRLSWWLEQAGLGTGPRLLVAASLLLEGWLLSGVKQAYSGGQFAPTPLGSAEAEALYQLEGHTISHPDMPDAVAVEAPDWIIGALQARFGQALRDEMAAMDVPATLDLRVNLLRGTRQQAIAALARENIQAEPTKLSPWGLRVQGRRPVTTGAAFQSGLVEIQDEGSQLVALIADARPDMRVVDWCAGAGGKTLALAMAMQNRGHIVACDVSAPRLEGAVKRLRRAGVHNVERHLVEPGDKWAKRRAGSFDRVLVDAPCTGTGTWRRNPDARGRLTPTDLAELVEKQQVILETAARLVKTGGRLVYATCSVLLEENEQQIARFLASNPNFRILRLPALWPLDTPCPCQGPYLSLTPLQHGTDGFFTAVLERVA